MQQYYELQAIEARFTDKDERMARMAMLLCRMTYQQVNTMPPNSFRKLSAMITRKLSCNARKQPVKRIGRYRIDYVVTGYRFAQYIEIQHFAKAAGKNIHNIIASAARPVWRKKNDSKLHGDIAKYMLDAKMKHVLPAVERIVANVEALNKKFMPPEPVKTKEEVEQERKQEEEKKNAVPVYGQITGESFNSRYGWQYSAHQVAEYRRITVDEAEELPTIEALNYAQYLRELQDHQKTLTVATQ